MVLKSVVDQKTIVANGYLVTLDANGDVGGCHLGSNWCAVHVQVAVNRDEPLMRPYSFFDTIGDAIGAPIAWPCSLVNILETLFSFVFSSARIWFGFYSKVKCSFFFCF